MHPIAFIAFIVIWLTLGAILGVIAIMYINIASFGVEKNIMWMEK